MQNLDLNALKAAALAAQHDGCNAGHVAFVAPGSAAAVTNPAQILAMIEDLEALGKLVRDLTGYIKMTAGDKPDSVRGDLLENARQLLEEIGV